jgi:hypothetical protein
MRALLLLALPYAVATPAATPGAPPAEAWRFMASYPRQYITHALQPSEAITVDGRLDEAAWAAVNWTEPMEDIAQAFHPADVIPASSATMMKVRYDKDYLYIGAKYHQQLTWATTTGHNDLLTNGQAPFGDDDFEVFLDPTGTAHWYVEYEMNARNATYDILWRETFGPDGPNRGNSTFYSGWTVHDASAEVVTPKPGWAAREQTWTMGPPGRPGGLRTATDLSHALGGMADGNVTADGGGYIDPMSPPPELPFWTLELAFPLHRSAAGTRPELSHGGLLDGPTTAECAGSRATDGACRGGELDMAAFDPNNGARYWWADFARTQHPVLTVGPTAELIGEEYFRLGEYYRRSLSRVDRAEQPSAAASPHTALMCAEVQKKWPSLLGAGPEGCSWEWVWQQIGSTRFMHNPEYWGLLQFEAGPPGSASLCGNVEWPVRHALTQVYRAERELMRLSGRYTTRLTELLDPRWCNTATHSSSCELADLRLLLGELNSTFGLEVTVDAAATRCASADTEGGFRYTGGACFEATSHYRQPGTGYAIVGRIDQDRYTTMRHTGAPGVRGGGAQPPCL